MSKKSGLVFSPFKTMVPTYLTLNQEVHVSAKLLIDLKHFLTLTFRVPTYPQKLSLNYYIYEVSPKYPRQSLSSFLNAFSTSFIPVLAYTRI